MPKIILLILISAAALIGIFYFYNPLPPPPKIDKTMLPSLPEAKEACLKQGGEWKKIGLSLEEKCNLRSTDAGKYCTDSSQCEGACLGQNKYSKSGKCSEWRLVIGCNYFVSDGKVDGILCVD